MNIIAIKDMTRKNIPIYYRKLYTGVAVIELGRGEPADYRIEFTIEYHPTGQKDISVTYVDTVDYPLVPLNKEFKKTIDALDSSGGLPD